MKRLKQIGLILLAMLLWTGFIGYGTMNGFLLKPINSENTSESFMAAAKEKISEEFVGSFAMMLIEDGKESKEFFYSEDQPVDEHTVFQVASVSKWLTAYAIMNLVKEGELDLDTPVDDFLTRWHLPDSEFDNKKVTVRRLLSHSAGLVDDLGYDGFGPNDTLQTLEESLTKAADAIYSEGVARVGVEPGTQYMYSGASYTILQLLIEEVADMSFQEYMIQEIFEPLGMDNSTFVLADKPDIQLAQFYDDNKQLSSPGRFTALAAASLFTSAADLSKFIQAHVSTYPLLSRETIHQMSEPEAYRGDIKVYGLGPALYSQTDKLSNIIGHDGSSGAPVINTAARVDLATGNGIIVLAMGNHSIATNLADEWLFSQAGIADYFVITRNKPFIIKLLVIGCLLILAIAVLGIRLLS